MINPNSANSFKLVTGLINLFPENIFLKNLNLALTRYPELVNDDWLSKGQVLSKQWLIKELEVLSLALGTVYLTPGWYGLLAHFIASSKLSFNKIRSFDINEKSSIISELLNHSLLMDGWKFKSTCCDIFDINFSQNRYVTIKQGSIPIELVECPDTVINTACEHLDFVKWLELIPEGKLLVLQNNNNRLIESHLFCVDSLDEFKSKCSLSEYYYSGTLIFDGYERYMLIGRK